MDFYTIRTSVDILNNRVFFDRVVSAIGFLTQPLIQGGCHFEEETNKFVLRFAVRLDAFKGLEQDFINLITLNPPFTIETIELIKAERI